MTASLGGVDVLVFTGGVGERAAPIRERATADLAYLGVVVDPSLNASARPDADLSAPAASVRTLVVAAREDLQIGLEVRGVL
jgi:acetate kinase